MSKVQIAEISWVKVLSGVKRQGPVSARLSGCRRHGAAAAAAASSHRQSPLHEHPHRRQERLIRGRHCAPEHLPLVHPLDPLACGGGGRGGMGAGTRTWGAPPSWRLCCCQVAAGCSGNRQPACPQCPPSAP